MLIQQLFPEGTTLKPKLRSQYFNNVLEIYQRQQCGLYLPENVFSQPYPPMNFSFIEFAGIEDTLTMKISLTFNSNQFRSAKYMWLRKINKVSLRA